MQKGKRLKGAAEGSGKRKKMALGKGLDALIPGADTVQDGPGDFFQCDIDLIRPNPYQPRRRFKEEELGELCESIRAQGIIQPLLVRKDGIGYELVAGERRLRAARMAGLEQVPVVIKDITDAEMLEMSIVENIQREDFNPIEEAEAYHRLMTEFNLTQDQAAERVGKSRPAVANFLRLRHLPEEIQAGIVDGILTMGHARALVAVESAPMQKEAFRTIISRRLSVRETEQLIRKLKTGKSEPRKTSPSSEEIYFSGVAEDLSRHFGTKVQIQRRGKKGKVEIEFYSNDDLDRLLELLKQD